MRWLVVLALAGCGDSKVMPDAPPPTFHLHMTLEWSHLDAPSLTSVAVDDVPLPEATEYVVDETYASYSEAIASFAPRTVDYTTSTGPHSTLLKPRICLGLSQETLKSLGRVIEENDICAVDENGVGCFMGTCTGVDGSAGFAATRRARTK